MPTSSLTLTENNLRQLDTENTPPFTVEKADSKNGEDAAHLFSPKVAKIDDQPVGAAPYQYVDSEVGESEYSFVAKSKVNQSNTGSVADLRPPLDILQSTYTSTVYTPRTPLPLDKSDASSTSSNDELYTQQKEKLKKANRDYSSRVDRAIVAMQHPGLREGQKLLEEDLKTAIKDLETLARSGKGLLISHGYLSEQNSKSDEVLFPKEKPKVKVAQLSVKKAQTVYKAVLEDITQLGNKTSELRAQVDKKYVDFSLIQSISLFLETVNNKHAERQALLIQAKEQCEPVGSQSEYKEKIQAKLNESVEELDALEKDITSFLTGKYLYFFIRKIRKTNVTELYRDKNKSVWDALEKLTSIAQGSSGISDYIQELKNKAKDLYDINIAEEAISSSLINESIQLLQDINPLHTQNALTEAKKACYLWFSQRKYEAKKEDYRAKTKGIKKPDQKFDLYFGLKELLEQEGINIVDALSKINSPIKYAEYFTKKALSESLAGPYMPFLIRQAKRDLAYLETKEENPEIKKSEIANINNILSAFIELFPHQNTLKSYSQAVEAEWKVVQALKDTSQLDIFQNWAMALDALLDKEDELGAFIFTDFFSYSKYHIKQKEWLDKRGEALTLKQALVRLVNREIERPIDTRLLKRYTVYKPLHKILAIITGRRELDSLSHSSLTTDNSQPPSYSTIFSEDSESFILGDSDDRIIRLLKAFIILPVLKRFSKEGASEANFDPKEKWFRKFWNKVLEFLKRAVNKIGIEKARQVVEESFKDPALRNLCSEADTQELMKKMLVSMSTIGVAPSMLSRRRTDDTEKENIDALDKQCLRRRNTDPVTLPANDSEVSHSTVPASNHNQADILHSSKVSSQGKNAPLGRQGITFHPEVQVATFDNSSTPLSTLLSAGSENNGRQNEESDKHLAITSDAHNPHAFFMIPDSFPSEQHINRARRRAERQKMSPGIPFTTKPLISAPK